jgi:uncharacterized membrane protein
MSTWSIILALIISFLPIAELRGGIPVAIATGLAPWTAFLLCVIVNILAIPFVFFFLDKIHAWLLRYKSYKNGFDKFLKRIQHRKRKVEKNINRYGLLALALFVAIPLPGTGAWTGTLIAWLLGLKRRRAGLAIALGVVIAGVIVTLAVTGIVALFKIFL